MKIIKLSTGPKHHFFGYYGINPWDSTRTHHLALETDFHRRRPSRQDVAAVGLISRKTHEFMPYGYTTAFNLQQGSMMHWIGEEFTFNDWDGDKLVSRAVNPRNGSMRTIQGAIAAVSPASPLAIGLNYGRMAHCRPVVGYANEMSSIVEQPEDDGLYVINLCDGRARLIISIADVVQASGDERLTGRRTWFNHVLFNPDGTRLLFFCRCRLAPEGTGMYSSLWTINPDGSDLALQIPFGYRISHFDWRTPEQILVSSDICGEMGFVEFTDGVRDFTPFGRGVLPSDGHASFSPDRQLLLCDTYPRGPERLASLMVYNILENKKTVLGEFHHEQVFVGDIRCDLHPRFSTDGRMVTFDSVHEGSRQIFYVNLKL